jgi:hypothetical protein
LQTDYDAAWGGFPKARLPGIGGDTLQDLANEAVEALEKSEVPTAGRGDAG